MPPEAQFGSGVQRPPELFREQIQIAVMRITDGCSGGHTTGFQATGELPQVLINAVTVHVGTRLDFSGFATNQELAMVSGNC
jgi:hypothetical protein